LPFRALGIEGGIHANLRFLREEGWLRSYREQRPVTRDGEPLPWYTYSATEFLAERLPADAAIFEFGAGYSTIWYAGRARKVVAVEPNRRWFDEFAPICPANARVVLREWPFDRDGYLAEIGLHSCRWDVVAIDSAWRLESSGVALEHLTDRGVIVWDNSRLPDFAEAMRDSFAPAGFRELPFGGLVPIVPSFDRTSILYRIGNCLGI
jgi:hypothetical protein